MLVGLLPGPMFGCPPINEGGALPAVMGRRMGAGGPGPRQARAGRRPAGAHDRRPPAGAAGPGGAHAAAGAARAPAQGGATPHPTAEAFQRPGCPPAAAPRRRCRSSATTCKYCTDQTNLSCPPSLPTAGLGRRTASFAVQVGQALLSGYGGSMEQLVGEARGSAAALVDLVARTFPGFRDCATYRWTRPPCAQHMPPGAGCRSREGPFMRL